MSNAFVNFLKNAGEDIKRELTIDNILNGSGNLRDWQHAARLYQDNYYQYTPKAGWLYFVTFEINPKLESTFDIDSNVRLSEFKTWKSRFQQNFGLLVKSIDLPRFTVDTETLNQYNRKVIVQKKINYSPVKVVFHDDMSNATTNLWKFYYQHYYADGDTGNNSAKNYFPTKYKRDAAAEGCDYEKFGFDTGNSIPFFNSITIHQLYQKHYTAIKLVNPLIKEWSHDGLDQTQGNKMMSSTMAVEYESVIYDAAVGKGYNKIKSNSELDFYTRHYDNSPSPLSIGGQGTVSLLGEGGIVEGILGEGGVLDSATDIFGRIGTDNPPSVGEIFNTAIKGGNVIRNFGKISTRGVLEETKQIAKDQVLPIAILGGAAAANSVIRGVGSFFGGAEKKDQTVTPALPPDNEGSDLF